MPFRIDQLKPYPGANGIRLLALGCNALLLVWIGWMITQAVTDWQAAGSNAPTAAQPDRKIARIPETPRREQYNIASWQLFGAPSTAVEKAAAPEKINAPETRLNLELNGVYLGERPQDSRAIIAEKGRQQEHYRVGDSLPGNTTLDEIHANHVLLLRSGRYERLALTDTRTTASAGISTATKTPKRRLGGQPREPNPAEAVPVSKLLSLIPVEADGNFLGMTVQAIGSEGKRLLQTADVKLKQFDVVTSVNGVEILSAEAGKALLDNYSSTERLELVIKRGRESFTVTLDPALSY